MKTFWFGAQPVTDLAVCRIVWFGFLFHYYLPRTFGVWGDVDMSFWRPLYWFDALGLGPASPQVLGVMGAIWKLSLLTACIGLLTRASIIVAVLLGAYLLGLRHCFGSVGHADAVVVLTLLVLAFSRCGDGWSVDRLVSRRRPEASGEYRWPIRCMWLLMASIFLAAGTAKLRVSGFEWANGENLAINLVGHQYTHRHEVWTDWGLWIAEHRGLCVALSWATLLIECGLVLALLHPIARAVLVPSALALLIGFPLLLGPIFKPLIAAFVFWVPWERLAWAVPEALRRYGDQR